jgi:choline dehydrogenase-like flavoprotein
MSKRLPIVDSATATQASYVLDADVVVVGSGGGGAVMAYELAAAGRSVVVLEAGPYVPSDEFTERYAEMMARLYADGGGQTNATGDLAILQGACVGGSTVVNGAVCFRTPDPVLAEWRSRFGLTDLTPERLLPYFEKVERRLSVHVNEPFEINSNSRILEDGCKKLGISSKPLSRNIRDCALTGFCLAGCASDRKQSMLVTYVPWAMEKGARVFADTQAETILVKNGRATGIRATMRKQGSGEHVADVTVNAKAVVLAAGAIQTPIMLIKNNLGNSSGQVGKNFACHPSLGILATFPEELYAYKGATLGTYCDEYEAPEKGGFILEGGTAGADFIAILAPGFGLQNLEFMRNFNRMAGMVSLIHDENSGEVTWTPELGKKIHYSLTEKDIPVIRQCMTAAARIFFAAGAEQVVLPTYVPAVIEREEDIEKMVAAMEIGQHTLRMTSYHPQGTCRMGADPATSVVSPTGELHDMKGLFVADASLFPTSIMVNPQISVFALSTYISEHVLNAI